MGFKMGVKERVVIDDERGDASEEVEVREAERAYIMHAYISANPGQFHTKFAIRSHTNCQTVAPSRAWVRFFF